MKRSAVTPSAYGAVRRLPSIAQRHRRREDGDQPITIDERLRLTIHQKLTELLGDEEADALIAHIMPVPWHDAATRDDLQLVRADVEILRREVRADRDVFRADLDVFRAELRVELHQAITAQTRWLMGYVTGFGVLMLAVARLLF